MKKLAALLLVVALAFAALPVASTAALAAENNDDKVLTLRLPGPLKSTYWENSTETVDMCITWIHVFEGLVGMDEAHGGYYNALAESIEANEDSTVYTVKLRDAKFHNGDKVMASDVLFSYKKAMANPRFNYVTNMIEDISSPDDKTIVFKLNKPYAAITHTFFSIKISSEKEITAAGDTLGSVPHKAGTGPYFFTEYDVASGVKLDAFNDYWDGAPAVKHLEYIVITEDSAAVIAYENGELGYLHDAPTTEWDALKAAAGDNCQMLKGNNIRLFFVNWQSKNNDSILANEKVRKAILFAVNKQNVNDVVTNGYGTIAKEFIPSDYCATSPKASEGKFEVYDYDPDKAVALLKEAGFTDDQLKAGVKVGTIMTYGAQTGEKAKAAQVIQANLKAIGLIAEVEVADASIITKRIHAYDYDMCLYGDSGNYDFNNVRQQVHSESVGMDCVRFKADDSPFNWQRIEELCALGVSTADIPQRYAYYTELWQIVTEAAVMQPYLHLPVGVCWRPDLNVGDLSPTYYRINSFTWK